LLAEGSASTVPSHACGLGIGKRNFGGRSRLSLSSGPDVSVCGSSSAGRGTGTRFGARAITSILLAIVFVVSGLATLPSTDPPIHPSDEEPVLEADISLTTVDSFIVSPARVYVGDTVKFTASAHSDVGSELNFTIKYDYELADGSVNPASPTSPVNVTGNPGSIVTTFVYDHVGNLTTEATEDPFFKAVLSVFDGYMTKNVTRYVYVVGNTAPVFTIGLASSYDVDRDVESSFSIKVSDPDNDPVSVTWDFGDGSDVALNETGPALVGVYVNQTHTWSPELEPSLGEYTINFSLVVTLDDGQGNSKASTSRIVIYIPYNFSPTGNVTVTATYVDPESIVWFYAYGSDGEGESLTWTFVFKREGVVYHAEAYQTDATEPNELVWVNISHVFSIEGNYTVTVYLSDAVLPELQTGAHNQTLRTVYVTSKTNRLPYVKTISITPTAPNITVDNPVALVEFYTEVADADGDVLTLTWDFGDDSPAVVNYTAGGKQVHGMTESHAYTEAGCYNVTLSVTDGWLNHSVYRWKVITIGSDNRAPSITEFVVIHNNGTYSLLGSPVHFRMVLYDLERDTIEVVWDFGDNSTILRVNLTDFDESGNVTCVVNHTYSERGEYTLTLTFTDHKFGSAYHNGSWFAIVRVRAPATVDENPWDLNDSVGLGIVVALVSSLVVWAAVVSRKRKKLDEMGMTWEEYQIRKHSGAEGGLDGEELHEPGGDAK